MRMLNLVEPKFFKNKRDELIFLRNGKIKFVYMTLFHRFRNENRLVDYPMAFHRNQWFDFKGQISRLLQVPVGQIDPVMA